MRSIKYLFNKGWNLHALFFLLFLNHSFGQELKEQQITISGMVKDFQKPENQKTIRLSIRSLINDDSPIVSRIDSNGQFKFTTSVAYAQNIIIHYGNAITLLCKPGDTLNLLIHRDKTGKFTATCLKGSLVKENNLMQEYLRLRDKSFPQDIEQDVIKNADPDEFKNYVHRQKQKEDSLLKQFCRSGRTSGFFMCWAEDYIRYLAWNKLLRYCWEHPMLNNQNKKYVSSPVSYFDFLTNYNMNDVTVISTPHADFMHEMYMRLANHLAPFTEISYQKEPRPESIMNTISTIINSIQKHTSGFTRDVFLTRLYVDILNGNDVEVFETCWQDSLIATSYYKRIIKGKKAQVVKFLESQNTNKAELITINNTPATGILDTILKRYAGKVIYLDFWAPWCLPCLEEMPAAKALQQEFTGKEKEIVFLFLSNRSGEASWKATIANYGLTGQHLNLTNDEFNVLAQAFRINGIPHYVIIDKAGRTVNPNAPAPGKKTALTSELNKLLE